MFVCLKISAPSPDDDDDDNDDADDDVIEQRDNTVGMGGTHGTHGIPRYQISRYQYRGSRYTVEVTVLYGTI